MLLEQYAREDFKDVSRYNWDQINFDRQCQSFSNFLRHLKKTANQGFDSKANEYVNVLQLGKLPFAIQNDLSVAGKQDTMVEQIGNFFQRRYQYKQLTGRQQPQPINEVSAGSDERLNTRPIRHSKNHSKTPVVYAFTATKKGPN